MALADEDRHGYAIIQDVAARTGGALRLSAGTLYRSIERMLEQGLIARPARGPARDLDDERRRYYRITPFGRAVAHAPKRAGSRSCSTSRAPSGLAPRKVVMRLYRSSSTSIPPRSARTTATRWRRSSRSASCATAAALARLRCGSPLFTRSSSNAPAAHWDILMQDLRYTVRTLNRARGFALTAILVTALGVGANTAAFSVADFVLLRPLPFPDPDTLVRLCEGPRTGGGWGCMNQLSPANYRDFKTMSASFEAMGAFTGDAVNLVGGGEPRRLAITPVTPEVLPAARRAAGARARVRVQASDDDRSAVVISYGLWQSQFGGDAGGARPDGQPQRRALHGHRRHAAGVLLSQPRRAAVDAADVPSRTTSPIATTPTSRASAGSSRA